MEPNKSVMPGVFGLIKQSLDLYKKNYKNFMTIGLVVLVISIVGNVLMRLLTLNQSTPLLILAVAFGLVFVVASFVMQIASGIAFMKAAKEYDMGTSLSVKDIYKESFKIFWSFIWVSILTALIFGGTGVFFFIPALIVVVYLSLAKFLVVLDGRKGLESLSTSFYYVRGNWWKVFWRIFGLMLILLVIISVIGVLGYFILHSFGFSFASLAVKNPSLLSGRLQTGGVWSLLVGSIISFIAYCVFTPILISYSYFIYKFLKSSKPEPIPETDLKTSRGWFLGLSIWGLVVGVLFFIIMLIAIPLMALQTARMKAQAVAQYSTQNTSPDSNSPDQSQVGMTPLFPKDTIVLPERVGSLDPNPYTSNELGFSINFPKKWSVTYDSQKGVTATPDSTSGPANMGINITKLNIPSNISTLSDDLIMEKIAQRASQNPGLKYVSFLKYSINSRDFYLVSGTLTLSTGDEYNANYYYIRNEDSLYVIAQVSPVKDWTSLSPVFSDVATTFKIIK